MTSTELIVLRKTPYKESSLIISGLSPDYGRLDFMIRGARKFSKKKFPSVDLFREIHVEFQKRKDGLQTLYNTELVTHFDAIASIPDNYMKACQLAAFVLKNSKPMMNANDFYKAVKNAFDALSKGPLTLPWIDLPKLVYFRENGLLPEALDGHRANASKEEQKKLLQDIIDFAVGQREKPEFSRGYWKKLSDWIKSMSIYHNME